MEIENDSCLYRVGRQVAENSAYRLYLCQKEGEERQCLLQIAMEVEHNGALQRAAFILGELARRAGELEEEYATVKQDPKVFLNYELGFPELVDSFPCHEQGGRQINILAFRNVEDVSRMVPLVNISEKDRVRVDVKTSVWIAGKVLKMYDFATSEGFSVNLSGNNILIEPDEHYVAIFDWTEAEIHSETVPAEVRRKQIAQAARAVITILGGDIKSGIFPGDEEGASQYTDYLLRLARGGESNTQRAHARFYEIVDLLWERKFHPFTTMIRK